jgi:hypothetical protein
VAVRQFPKPGSKTAIVLPYLQREHFPPASVTIAQATGLSLREVRTARARLFRYHYLPPPTSVWLHESRSMGRGTIWPQIARYARMNMTPQEIVVAAQLEIGCTLPYGQVENALNKAWKGEMIPRRTAEEAHASRLDALHRGPTELRERVKAWLEVAGQLAWGVREDEPSTRTEWLEQVEQERARRRDSDGILPQYGPLVARLLVRTQSVLLENDPESIARLRQQEASVLPRLLIGQPELVPDDVLGRSYLLDLYHARRLWAETGDRSQMDAFPAFYEEVEPGISERLARAIARIRDLTPVQRMGLSVVPAVAWVAHSDVEPDWAS